MIRLNRTTEYALIALRHMMSKRSSDPEGVTSAREVADHYQLPFEITAKTLQRLRDAGLIQSAHGARGGYALNLIPEEVTLAEFLRRLEGPQSVVACVGLLTDSPHSAAVQPAVEIASPQPPSASSKKKNPIGRPPSPKSADGSACACEYRTTCEIQSVMNRLNARVLHFLESIRLSELLASSSNVAAAGNSAAQGLFSAISSPSSLSSQTSISTLATVSDATGVPRS